MNSVKQQVTNGRQNRKRNARRRRLRSIKGAASEVPGSNIVGAHRGRNSEKYTKTQRKTQRVRGLEILLLVVVDAITSFTPIRNAPAVAAAAKAPVQNDDKTTNRRNARTSD
jgi:hypothetical protein